MTPAQAISRLMAAFGQDKSAETVAIYAENLADIPPDLLAAAVNHLIESTRFFPAIAEIRRSVAQLSGLMPAEAPEAMAKFRRAFTSMPLMRRDGTPTGDTIEEIDWTVFEDDPITEDLVRDTVARVGAPGNFGWEMGFQKTYEAAAEPVIRKALSDLSRARLSPRRSLEIGSGS